MTADPAPQLDLGLPAELIARPGSPQYADATSPDNTSVAQAPALVVHPRSSEQTAEAVAAILAAPGRAMIGVQATGHGAGRPVGDDEVLVDTRGLAHVRVDAAARRATAGSGAVWSQVQAAAEPEGLLGRSGTSPGVGVGGYTFAGGVGWLVRPHGLGAAGLEAVRFVDGTGALRLAAADAPDELDRAALWAFRGGAPVGIATELSVSLVPRSELAAGYLLWPDDLADALITAWSRALGALSATVTSTLSLLAVPPEGPFPDALLGRTAVHLAYASPAGVDDLSPLGDALRAVAAPALDTTGPCDAERLATIHLDPPVPVPARGLGRWLGDVDPRLAVATLRAARIGQDRGLNMIELRHLAGSPGGPGGPGAVGGAMTAPPSPFLLHAVGGGADAAGRAQTDEVLAAVLAAAAPADTGLDAPSFAEGQPAAGVTHDPATLTRLGAIRRALDPDRRLRFQRGLPDQ